jgi:DNA ligase 1
MSLADIPPHKLIPTGNGGHLLIDGFNYAHRAACSGHGHVEYLLSHGHSDHYTGIRSDWSLGPIYCSDITAKLIAHLIGVDASFLHPLPLNRATTLPSGCQVTLIDANHCPGAVIFLIKLPDGRKVIHTGDFRLSEAMLTCPLLRNFRGAEALYLDTTYCSPKYAFPPQDVAVEYTASTIHHLLQEDVPYRRLFLISTYVIGKERIFQEVAKRCGVKIYASDRKAAVMACLEDVLPQELFTDDPAATPVHLVPWNGFLGGELRLFIE